MFASILIRKLGGHLKIINPNLNEVKLSIKRITNDFPDDYIAVILPYECTKKKLKHCFYFDNEPSIDIMKSIGLELRIQLQYY